MSTINLDDGGYYQSVQSFAHDYIKLSKKVSKLDSELGHLKKELERQQKIIDELVQKLDHKETDLNVLRSINDVRIK